MTTITDFIHQYYDIKFQGDIESGNLESIKEFVISDTSNLFHIQLEVAALFINTFASATDSILLEEVRSMEPNNHHSIQAVWLNKNLNILGWDCEGTESFSELKQKICKIEDVCRQALQSSSEEEKKELEERLFGLIKQVAKELPEVLPDTEEQLSLRRKSILTSLEQASSKFNRIYLNCWSDCFDKMENTKFCESLKNRNIIVLSLKPTISTKFGNEKLVLQKRLNERFQEEEKRMKEESA
jgi:hypothetical protein